MDPIFDKWGCADKSHASIASMKLFTINCLSIIMVIFETQKEVIRHHNS